MADKVTDAKKHEINQVKWLTASRTINGREKKEMLALLYTRQAHNTLRCILCDANAPKLSWRLSHQE